MKKQTQELQSLDAAKMKQVVGGSGTSPQPWFAVKSQQPQIIGQPQP
jgi:hypothetical protein